MKTLLSILSVLLVTAAAMAAADPGSLDAGSWLIALFVAGLFGLVLNERRPRTRPFRRPA